MKRSSAWLLVIMATIGITAVVAFAANVHLKHSPPLTFTDNTGPAPSSNLTLSADGALTGLGGGDVVITLTASANPTGQCCNPSGACKVPGQNPASVQITGAQALPGADIKNGNLSFVVSTAPPETPIPNAPDCPNTSWAENITDLVFTSAVVTVYQPAILACGLSGTPCTSDSDCSGGVSCVPVNANNNSQAAQSVFVTNCTLSGVDGALTRSCP